MTTSSPCPVSVATPIPIDSHGAIDLLAHASAPTPTESVAPVVGEGLHIPFITIMDEENSQDVMSTFQAVLAIMVMWSPHSLESKPTLTMPEEIAHEQAGKSQLVEIDIDQAPTITQTFQIQGVPTIVALIGRHPVPLFQSVAPKEQMLPIVTQVLNAVAQMGIMVRTTVVAEDTVAPIPPEREAPLAAEAAGNLDKAVAGWQKIIELNSRNEDAKPHLPRVRLVARSAQVDATDPIAHVDVPFVMGDAAGTFDVLLDLFTASTDVGECDALRLRLLDPFRAAGPFPEVSKARTRLTMLFM